MAIYNKNVANGCAYLYHAFFKQKEEAFRIAEPILLVMKAFNFVRNVCKYNVWNGCNFNMTYDFIPRCRAQDACEILNQNPLIMQNCAWIGL